MFSTKFKARFESEVLSKPRRTYILLAIGTFFFSATIFVIFLQRAKLGILGTLPSWVLLLNLFLFVTLSFGPLIYFWNYLLPNYHRTILEETFRELAQRFDLKVVPQSKVKGFMNSLPLRLTLFLRSQEPVHFSNVIHGNLDDIEITIFDYAPYSNKYLVVCFQFYKSTFPTFMCHPETSPNGFLNTIFGISEIAFDGHPDFSKKYWLNGEDEATIRKTFSSDVIAHYEHTQTNVSTEADSHALLYYRRKPSNPTVMLSFIEDVPSFVEGAIEVMYLMRKAAPHPM